MGHQMKMLSDGPPNWLQGKSSQLQKIRPTLKLWSTLCRPLPSFLVSCRGSSPVEMASNPPIANFHANGSLDLQTRINRFLTTIEPHARFFTVQGRTHLDSLIERDKIQERALKADKTGWATPGFDQTTSLIDIAHAGEDATGSGRSVTAMSSVSQRGALRSRMRDRYGNTTAMITAVRAVKLPKNKPKPKDPLAHVLNTSSSSPIKPWKDIRPKSPVEATPQPKVTLEPVVEIPIYTSNDGDAGSKHAELCPAEECITANGRKRKLIDKDAVSSHVNPKKTRNQGKSVDDVEAASSAKKDKRHHTSKVQRSALPLGESSTKLNSAAYRQDRKEKDKALPEKNLRSKASVKGSKQQKAVEKEEDQAREESGS